MGPESKHVDAGQRAAVLLWLLRAAVLPALAVLTFASCGGRTQAPRLEQAPGELSVDSKALPELSKLALPAKQLSMEGPGYYAIPPLEAMQWGNALPGPAKSLSITGGASLGFALYGVYGFDGDNGPTSARITTTSVSGEYFVAFSDYISGKWSISGPFDTSATAEIRLPDGQGIDAYTSATAFTSAAHATYLAVIVGPGSTLQLDRLELGVQGGHNAPKMPYVSAYGPPGRFYIRILPVKSEFAPDYGGFMIERAPQFRGDYAPLFTQPIKQRYYNDDTTQDGTRYRYRVAAVDASGNRSPWFTFTAGPESGLKADPIVKLDAPRGPLQGKSTVTFDLSGSLDPEGIGIATYKLGVYSYTPAPYAGASPVVSMTLQPGCYIVTAQVETTDGREDKLVYPLKIYPTWEDAPVVVAEAQVGTGVSRMRPVSLGRFGSTGRLLAVGGDFVSGGILAWYEPPPAIMNWTPRFLTQSSQEVAAISEPVELQGALYVAASDGGMINVLQCQTGAATSLGFFRFGYDGTPVALAADGDARMWTVYATESGGQYTLIIQDVHGSGDSYDVQLNIGSPDDVDAVFNPETQAVEIMLGADVGTEWLRWDLATQAVTDSWMFNGASSAAVDIELNPVSGRPAVMFVTGNNHQYSEMQAGNFWSAQETVDNSVANRAPCDMEFDNAGVPYAYFALNTGQAHLYQRTGVGVWTIRNTPPDPTDSGFSVDMVNVPGTADFVVADTDVPGNVHLLELQQSGSCVETWWLDSTEGLGRWLSGAAGTLDQTPTGAEELHASFGTLNPFATTRHCTSTDQGQSWTPQNDMGLVNTSLAATAAGNVYLSGWSAGSNWLDLWSPTTTSFSGVANLPSSQAHAPFVYGDLGGDNIYWFSYDDAATTLHLGLYDGAVASMTYTSTPAQLPIWAGAYAQLGGSIGLVCLADAAQIDDAGIYYGDPYNGEMNLIDQPSLGTGQRCFSHPLVELRQVASANYVSNYGADEGALLQPATFATALFSSSGHDGKSLRFDLQDDGSLQTTDLPLPDLTSLLMMRLETEPRRTASALEMPGLTAVAIVAGIDGKDAYFAWSNYGDWEELPLPRGLSFMSLPQLFMGRDGTWYMLYHDWRADRIMCIRSL